jgi:hypothetical protein
MDDPTSRCENGTDNETHSPGPPIPSGGLNFFHSYFQPGETFLAFFAPQYIAERRLVPPLGLVIPEPHALT